MLRPVPCFLNTASDLYISSDDFLRIKTGLYRTGFYSQIKLESLNKESLQKPENNLKIKVTLKEKRLKAGGQIRYFHLLPRISLCLLFQRKADPGFFSS
jgi:hypothetical protein